MVRKCAAFASALALSVALGYAMAHVHALRAPGTSDFSAPCEPVSTAFKAAGKLKASPTIDSTFTTGSALATADGVRRYRLETVAPAISLAAPQTFPPLLHRPPPSNS